MVKRQLLGILAALTLIVTISAPAHATQSLNYWYSDENYVYYTPYDGSYYVYNYSTDTNFQSYLTSALSTARSQWNKVLPIGITETSFNYALNFVYGGVLSQLRDKFPGLANGMDGCTMPCNASSLEIVQYGNSGISVYRQSSGTRMAIVEQYNQTATRYTNTALHEMGHLFGWRGHSTNSSDVMYKINNGITTLTSRDKNHLKQIYDLFY